MKKIIKIKRVEGTCGPLFFITEGKQYAEEYNINLRLIAHNFHFRHETDQRYISNLKDYLVEIVKEPGSDYIEILGYERDLNKDCPVCNGPIEYNFWKYSSLLGLRSKGKIHRCKKCKNSFGTKEIRNYRESKIIKVGDKQ